MTSALESVENTPQKWNCCIVCSDEKICVRFTSDVGVKRNLLNQFSRYVGIEVNDGGLCKACDSKLKTIISKSTALREQCEKTLGRFRCKRMSRSPKCKEETVAESYQVRKRKLFESLGGKFDLK